MQAKTKNVNRIVGRKRKNKKTAPSGNARSLPKKPWRDTKVVKTDARVASDPQKNVGLSNEQNTITVSVDLSQQQILAVAVGYLSGAFQRGFVVSEDKPETAYFALTYLVNLLYNYSQSSFMPTIQMPYWLLCLGHAISPKTVPFSLGSVNYKFNVGGNSPAVVPVTVPIGYSSYSVNWNSGNVTPNPQVDGFPTVNASGAGYPAYSESAGATAFQSLCQFMTNPNDRLLSRLSRMVAATERTPFLNDVSAFSRTSLSQGLGFTGNGGGVCLLNQLEVPIFHPIISLFNAGANLVEEPTRLYNITRMFAGDGCFLGTVMSTIFTTGQLRTYRMPRLKPVDFLEFGEVVAFWIQQMVDAWILDKATNATALTQLQFNAICCPLTLQEVLILLRAVMIGAWKESQPGVQSIYPYIPAGSGDNQFVPFIVSPGTCALNVPNMMLPVPLIENIRALSMRLIRGRNASDILAYMPILGQFIYDQLRASDYSVSYLTSDAGVITRSVFATGILREERAVGNKGERVVTPLLEQAINLIDGSSGPSFVAINDPGALTTLVSLWNEWLPTSGLQSYSTKLAQFGSETGISLLCSISMTRLFVNQSNGIQHKSSIKYERTRRRNSSKLIVDKRFEGTRHAAVLLSPYSGKKVIVDTSQGQILSAPWEQILSLWILPSVEDQFIINEESTVSQRWQFIMGEPFSVVRSSGSTGITLSSLHSAFASKMVKANLSAPDDYITVFNQFESQGRGGILSSLAASLIGNLSPTAGSIASAIASTLPI